MRTPRAAGGSDLTWLVALAAALWGLDGLLRRPLAETINPGTVVLWEHLIIVLIVAPFVPRALRVFAHCSPRDRFALLVIGGGCSAVGTALFTQSFKLAGQSGDFVTPLVLQKLQPLVAVVLAVVLLHERLRPRFALFAVPALVGAWMLTFGATLSVSVSALAPALFAIGAAVLWASGTVLGRLVAPSVQPRDLTVLRFTFGLPAALIVATVVDAPLWPGADNLWPLFLLALIPGLLALSLYYIGLRRTPASRATFAELAFPATSALVGVLFLGSDLKTGQWVGFGLLIVAVTALGLSERSRRPSVEAPELVPAGAAPSERR